MLLFVAVISRYKIMFERNPFLTTSDIAEMLDSAQKSISDHIPCLQGMKLNLSWAG